MFIYLFVNKKNLILKMSTQFPLFTYEGKTVILIPGRFFNKNELNYRLNQMEIQYYQASLSKNYFIDLYENALKFDIYKIKIFDLLLKDTNYYSETINSKNNINLNNSETSIKNNNSKEVLIQDNMITQDNLINQQNIELNNQNYSLENAPQKENINIIYSEKPSLIRKLKSFIILENIFNYIDDPFFNLKLFFYSKKLQETYKIDKQKIFAKKLEYSQLYLNYLACCLNGLENEFHWEPNDKTFERFVLYNYKKQKIIGNIEEDLIDEARIGYNIPIFNSLSKTKDFGEKFFIVIPKYKFEESEIKNKFIEVFDNLNKSNINYTSIIFEGDNPSYYIKLDNESINKILKEHLNYNQIKRLAIYQSWHSWDFDSIFETILSYPKYNNNLEYLHINFRACPVGIINYNNLNNLNKFKSLKQLKLKGFIFFDVSITLDLPNLKIISLTNCQNITLSENTCTNLKKIYLNNFSSTSSPLLKLPNVEKLAIYNSNVIDFFDFSSFKNLKYLECNEEDEFNKIDAPLLETIYLIRNEKYISSYQKGMLKLKKNEKEILLEKTENEEEKKKLKKDLKKINSYLENENYYIDLEKQSLEKIIFIKKFKKF